MPAGVPVVAVPRVSSDNQVKNLPPQVKSLKRWCRDNGHEVFATIGGKQSGKVDTEDRYELSYLHLAVEAAKECGGCILMESVSRALRSREYEKDNQQAVPDEKDRRHLGDILQGTPVYFLVDPGASPAEERSEQIKRGQRGKNRKGGRPRKKPVGWRAKRKRWEVKWVVKCARRHPEWSLRQIRDRLREEVKKHGKDPDWAPSHVTIRKWLHEAKGEPVPTE
jgi:hypothetical protein